MVFNVIINKQEIVNKAKMSILSLILKEQSVIFFKECSAGCEGSHTENKPKTPTVSIKSERDYPNS